jgi:hypothetical protein
MQLPRSHDGGAVGHLEQRLGGVAFAVPSFPSVPRAGEPVGWLGWCVLTDRRHGMGMGSLVSSSLALPRRCDHRLRFLEAPCAPG